MSAPHPILRATSLRESRNEIGERALGVYVLVAPEPDRQQPHENDEVYVVFEGNGMLEVEGESLPVVQESAVFVEAGAEHRFSAYEQLSVLVIFDRLAAGNP